jgi:hypothetical protein
MDPKLELAMLPVSGRRPLERPAASGLALTGRPPPPQGAGRYGLGEAPGSTP